MSEMVMAFTGIMPYRRGHSDAVNIDANQMDASKIDATIYQKYNKRFLFTPTYVKFKIKM